MMKEVKEDIGLSKRGTVLWLVFEVVGAVVGICLGVVMLFGFSVGFMEAVGALQLDPYDSSSIGIDNQKAILCVVKALLTMVAVVWASYPTYLISLLSDWLVDIIEFLFDEYGANY